MKKTLNTIGLLKNFSPANDELRELYNKIDNGNHPERESIASTFSVTVEQYNQWMKSLFMILVPRTVQGVNLLELMLKDFFENIESFINVYINSFSDESECHHVLLSDRSFTLLIDSEVHTAYEFNLTANAFISYVFTDIKKMAASHFSTEEIQDIISLKCKKPSEVKVHINENELDVLSRYNKNVVYQSFRTVFCKSKQVYGL